MTTWASRANALIRGPEAVTSGLLRRSELRRDYQAVFPGVYLKSGWPLDAVTRAQAAWLWADGRAVLCGRSAAAVWGADGIPDSAPAAICTKSHLRPPPGIEVYRSQLSEEDHQDWLSLRVTTPVRTACDLGRHLALTEAVTIIESLYRCAGLTRTRLAEHAREFAGIKGAAKLNEALLISDQGTRSPLQTQVRLALLRSTLPAPETRIPVYGDHGELAGEAAIGWRRQRVAITCVENDQFEAGHCGTFDNHNTLVSHGWLMLATGPSPHPSEEYLNYRTLIRSASTALMLRRTL